MMYRLTTSATWPLPTSKVTLCKPFKRVSLTMAARAVPITAMERSNGKTVNKKKDGYFFVLSDHAGPGVGTYTHAGGKKIGRFCPLYPAQVY
jgi:hypothetical protein